MSNSTMHNCPRGIRLSDGKCKRKPGPKPKRKPGRAGGGGFGAIPEPTLTAAHREMMMKTCMGGDESIKMRRKCDRKIDNYVGMRNDHSSVRIKLCKGMGYKHLNHAQQAAEDLRCELKENQYQRPGFQKGMRWLGL